MLTRMKIRTRLLLAFGIVLILYVVTSFTSLVTVDKVAGNMDTFYDTAHAASNKAWETRRDIRLLEASVYRAIANNDAQITKQSVDQAFKSAEAFNANLTQIASISPTQADLARQALQIASDAKSTREQILNLASINQNQAALELMEKTYVPKMDEIIDLLSQIGTNSEAEAKAFVDNSNKTSNFSMLVLIGMGLLVAAFIVFISIVITRSITIPTRKIVQRIEKLAEGDLNSPMPVIGGNDEITVLANSTDTLVKGIGFMMNDMTYALSEMSKGNLAFKQANVEYKGDFLPLQKAIQQITHALNDTLTQINMASQQVSSGAEQVSGGAQALAQGATEQASSVEELSASIAEISAQVKQNAENSVKANQMANQATSAIESSNNQMQKLMGAMEEISSSSSEIKKIIKTIEDIAFQTNILALNAAVEAARAGAAGKGFAVVADEVRNLATKSSEAAKNTTQLIEKSLVSVQHGAKLADETAAELSGIVEGSNATSALIAEVTKASNEQAISIAQVNLGVEQISAVVQTNSATSEESAAAAEELSSQAALMKSLIARFQLANDSSSVFEMPAPTKNILQYEEIYDSKY